MFPTTEVILQVFLLWLSNSLMELQDSFKNQQPEGNKNQNTQKDPPKQPQPNQP